MDEYLPKIDYEDYVWNYMSVHFEKAIHYSVGYKTNELRWKNLISSIKCHLDRRRPKWNERFISELKDNPTKRKMVEDIWDNLSQLIYHWEEIK